jgi:hypothetical protein
MSQQSHSKSRRLPGTVADGELRVRERICRQLGHPLLRLQRRALMPAIVEVWARAEWLADHLRRIGLE